MKRAVIAKYFTNLKDARADAERKNKTRQPRKKNEFVVIRFKKGYLVLSKRQLK